MTSPTLPNFPLPPLLPSVSTLFKDWEKHIQTSSNENVFVVPFKIVLFGLRELIYGFGYLSAAGQGDVLTGDSRVADEDYNWNPETAWHGGDSLANRKKMPVTATLTTVNGHSQILLIFGAQGQFQYTAALTGVSGHDPSFTSAMLLTGDRTGTAGGKVLASFEKDFIEKTHWPPSF